MIPEPLVKVPVRPAVPPTVIVVGLATKLVMTGAATVFTVTVTGTETLVPAALVTVRV
jgi:hypothetical protein